MTFRNRWETRIVAQWPAVIVGLLGACATLPAVAATAAAGWSPQIVSLGPVPLDFIFFACVLLGIALGVLFGMVGGE